jgi:3-methylcrotonyl-CoA carboxylase alpha subunit
VEFIAEPDGRFYFMEMNTRLQVEHPVTEMVTGLDLVEWQLRVAAGEPLPRAQAELALQGHAIEARIYAEDAERGFLPATGRLVHLRFPEGVRVDTGVEAGAEITPWYDPMIAKLIVHGADRSIALSRLRQALAGVEIAGVVTNVRFLRRIVASQPFAAAELDTGLIERNRESLFPPSAELEPHMLAAAAYAELCEEQATARERAHASGDPHSPWHSVDGWRLNEDSHHDFAFAEGDRRHAVRVRFLEAGQRIAIGEREWALQGERLADGTLLARLDGHAAKVRAVRDGLDWHLFCDGDYVKLRLRDELAGLDVDAGGGSLAAPMPGKVVAVLAKSGEAVEKGTPLVILEAMKMEHTITAPARGRVKEVRCAPGEQVAEGVELIAFEAE